MKKIIPILTLVCVCKVIMAQQPQTMFASNPYPKTIFVSGSAEMEVVPDEIYVNIELREYQKKGEAKKDIETIKTQFLEYCKAANIPDSAISIASYSGYNNYYNFRRKKNIDMNASITYQVKFRSSKTMDDLVERLDDNATQSFVIASTSHSKIIEYRKQLKIKAVQAAKDKGIYLTEAVGEKLGEAITITEPSEGEIYNQYSQSNMLSNNALYLNREQYDSVKVATEADFKKIKLRFEVNVLFALK
ncbi:MAG: SIMPL domain-containing protein [Chitinophagaceae bacterium]